MSDWDFKSNGATFVQLSASPKGPYFIQLNRWLLEENSAVPLPNPFATDWIDCFVFVYSSERRIVLKSANHDITWKLEVDELQPVLTTVNDFEGKDYVVHLTNILGARETPEGTLAPECTETELMMSFKTAAEKKDFNNHIIGWAWDMNDDQTLDDDASVASDAQPVTKEDDKFEEEEAELEKKAAVEAEEDDLGVNVNYKGPYLVQMNRFLLEKSARKGRGILHNRLKSHWIDCFAFVYPVERKMLIYHSIKESKEAKDGITWKFEIGDKYPMMTDITVYQQKANVVHLTGVLEVPETWWNFALFSVSGRDRELMLSFKTSPERKEFTSHIKRWVQVASHQMRAEEEENDEDDEFGYLEDYVIDDEYEEEGSDYSLDYLIICTQCHKKGAQGTYYETSECTEVTLNQGMITGTCPKSHTFNNTVDD